jgi:hypothetical protein
MRSRRISGGIEVFQLLTRPLLHLSIEPLHEPTTKYPRPRILVPEGPDHNVR